MSELSEIQPESVQPTRIPPWLQRLVAALVAAVIMTGVTLTGAAPSEAALAPTSVGQSVEQSVPVALGAAAPSEAALAPASVGHSVAQSVPTDDTLQKTAAFTGCIFSVGIPIGVAWEMAFNPAVAKWVMKRGPLPPTVGGAVARWVAYAQWACRYAIFGR